MSDSQQQKSSKYYSQVVFTMFSSKQIKKVVLQYNFYPGTKYCTFHYVRSTLI